MQYYLYTIYTLQVLETLSCMVEHDPKAAERLAGALSKHDPDGGTMTRIASAIRADGSAMEVGFTLRPVHVHHVCARAAAVRSMDWI